MIEAPMLTLDLPVQPYWLALPRGVRVEIRPVTAAVMAATQAAAARRFSALRAAEPDLDPDMARSLAFALLVKALARHAILAWEGIGAICNHRWARGRGDWPKRPLAAGKRNFGSDTGAENAPKDVALIKYGTQTLPRR
jgi:hypothetical protein